MYIYPLSANVNDTCLVSTPTLNLSDTSIDDPLMTTMSGAWIVSQSNAIHSFINNSLLVDLNNGTSSYNMSRGAFTASSVLVDFTIVSNTVLSAINTVVSYAGIALTSSSIVASIERAYVNGSHIIKVLVTDGSGNFIYTNSIPYTNQHGTLQCSYFSGILYMLVDDIAVASIPASVGIYSISLYSKSISAPHISTYIYNFRAKPSVLFGTALATSLVKDRSHLSCVVPDDGINVSHTSAVTVFSHVGSASTSSFLYLATPPLSIYNDNIGILSVIGDTIIRD